ncbi:MAG: copper-translocating P-type ATPase [Microbacterium sp. SCN 70-27]|uniref:heavy metal translocating P-type ATPase n=1 Tax=unclassified Microbacterium TaxID=2609290 RepID=UPI00086F6EB8|nr:MULTISPECIES: heavy metal translocating P-type ATPase [unclassified Microbacterium]MBN9224532.1 copper-translocating P-type ATPase [Microbacterium sp.]ODT27090.1 MAG: copper-translocating P-type ATPase [Microbacterium sp. SCN 70-27]
MTGAAGAPQAEAVLDIEGMTCASCVARVEKRLGRLDGVEASVNLATESAKVRYPEGLDTDALVAAVREAGYDASVRRTSASAPPARTPHAHHTGAQPGGEHAEPTDHSEPEHAEHASGHVHDVEDRAGRTTLRTRLIVSAALAVPVVLLGMIPALQFPGWQWVSFALTTPVILWGGWPFHRATFANARHGAMTMDTLITLGTGAAYLWSVWALLFGTAGRIGMTHDSGLFEPVHDPSSLVYFEVAAAVTVFLLLGRYIEQRSKRRAGAALHALLDLAAKDVELEDGTRMPVEHLQVGDRFLVRPGEKVATDGVVVSGQASLDESMITGEAVPVEASAGSEVTGGTLAADGRLIVEATSVGADTRLAHLARLVEDAQSGKSRVQRLADRISAVFVPIVIALAVLTLLGWMIVGGFSGESIASGFTAAVAVLIIACPCALGLATPIAILVGTGRGAQLGVLITGPEALESAERIDTIVLDKTGTVTSGEMTVTSVTPVGGATDDEVAHLIGSLEQASEHPIARAVAALAPNRAPVADFAGLAGRGVTGVVDGHTVFAGRPAFAADVAGALPDAASAAVTAAEAAGATAVVGGWDGAVRAVIAVADTVRGDSAETVAELRGLGLDVVLLTGDNEGAARAAASAVGIEDVIAGVLPEGKVAEIERLQAAGHRVAMVGDGVNDAAALATADLGLAMGGGTDAAMHASDIALAGHGLTPVATAVRLSRRTMRIIRGNLFWAFAYNVAALPLAALGFLNPMIAGAAMAFSSVFVVLNSLRLRSTR